MKLRYSKTSPFVRKVRMTAWELDLTDRIVLDPTDAWSPATTLPQDNPLGKVPTLVLEDGSTLYDSAVICEYLDSLGGTPKLFPTGPERWIALKLQALADGICDAAVLARLEAGRAEGERSPSWIERQKRAMVRGCDALEADIDTLSGPVTIGTLAVLAALGYLDLRFPEDDWRGPHPRLARWFETAGDRPGFRHTDPARS